MNINKVFITYDGQSIRFTNMNPHPVSVYRRGNKFCQLASLQTIHAGPPIPPWNLGEFDVYPHAELREPLFKPTFRCPRCGTTGRYGQGTPIAHCQGNYNAGSTVGGTYAGSRMVACGFTWLSPEEDWKVGLAPKPVDDDGTADVATLVERIKKARKQRDEWKEKTTKVLNELIQETKRLQTQSTMRISVDPYAEFIAAIRDRLFQLGGTIDPAAKTAVESIPPAGWAATLNAAIQSEKVRSLIREEVKLVGQLVGEQAVRNLACSAAMTAVKNNLHAFIPPKDPGLMTTTDMKMEECRGAARPTVDKLYKAVAALIKEVRGNG